VDGKTFFLAISFFLPQFFDTLDTHAWPRFKSLDIVKAHNKKNKTMLHDIDKQNLNPWQLP
jgi:hypothetical protein